jgi:hypothetical protein
MSGHGKDEQGTMGHVSKLPAASSLPMVVEAVPRTYVQSGF